MEIVETSIYTADITKLLSDEDYNELQKSIAQYPKAGDVIVGSKGLRLIMDEKNFDRLLSSVKEAKEIINKQKDPSRTFFIDEPNPREIRDRLSLTQEKFAQLMNISVHTLRNWEQGRRRPEGTARVLLNVVNSHPEVLMQLG